MTAVSNPNSRPSSAATKVLFAKNMPSASCVCNRLARIYCEGTHAITDWDKNCFEAESVRAAMLKTSQTAEIAAVILECGDILCHRPSPEEVGPTSDSIWTEHATVRRTLGSQPSRIRSRHWTAIGSDLLPKRRPPSPAGRLNSCGNGRSQCGVISISRWSDDRANSMTLESRLQFCQTCTPTAEVGLVKPDAAIYEHTLRGLGTTPAQACLWMTLS